MKAGRLTKKLLSVMLVLALSFTFVPAQAALAASGTIDLSDPNPPISGVGWTYGNNKYSIMGDVTITGSTTTKTVMIIPGFSPHVTLQDAVIDVSAINSLPAFDSSAVSTTLTVLGESKLISGSNFAGLRAPSGGSITIDGPGILEAYGGADGAGIGGNSNEACGTITINGGSIIALGGTNGTGIGAGRYGNASGSAIINGDSVVASGSYMALKCNISVNASPYTYWTNVLQQYPPSPGISGSAIPFTNNNNYKYVKFDARKPAVNTGGSASAAYNAAGIDLQGIGSLFNVSAKAGARIYTIEPGGTGEGIILSDGFSLGVTKTGTFNIGLETMESACALYCATVTGTLTVTKAPGGICPKPVLQAATKDGIAVQPSGSLPNGQSVEYAISLSPNPAPSVFQDGTVFTGLTADTQYYVFGRAKANDLYESGAPVNVFAKTLPADSNVLYTPSLKPVSGNVISGGGAPPSGKVIVQLSSGAKAETTADANGNWSLSITGASNATSVAIWLYFDQNGAPLGNPTILTPKIAVASVAMPQKTLYMVKGTKLQLKYVVYPTTASSKKLTWKSSKKTIASVTTKGLVKALKTGITDITAKTSNNKQFKLRVYVVGKKLALKSVTAYKPPKTIKRTSTAKLVVKLNPAKATGAFITFGSSNSKVLKVDAAGKLTPVKKGTAYITVKAAGKSSKIKIVVR